MKRNSVILSLVIATGLVFVHPSAGMAQATKETSEARRLYSEGRELLDDGNYADAEKKFREALNKYPRADQADRTTYYLIVTLEKLRRFQDARTEMENFNRNFPGSIWREDVDQKRVALGGSGNSSLEQQLKILKERDESARRGSPELPPNASVDAMILQMIILQNPYEGIEKVKERLKKDPADQAVYNNLGTIFSSNSPQALAFLLELSNSAASPNIRTVAFFYAMRLNPDKVQVANTLMEMLKKKENEPIVSEALYRMPYEVHRAVLAKIVESGNPTKFDAIEKIYRGGSITLRSDLLMAVAKLKDDSRAESFIVDAAKNDKDETVRRAAVDALTSMKGTANVKLLENILRPAQIKKPAVPPPPTRFTDVPAPTVRVLP